MGEDLLIGDGITTHLASGPELPTMSEEAYGGISEEDYSGLMNLMNQLNRQEPAFVFLKIGLDFRLARIELNRSGTR